MGVLLVRTGFSGGLVFSGGDSGFLGVAFLEFQEPV